MEKVTVTITLDRNEIVDLANKLERAFGAGRGPLYKHWQLDAQLYKDHDDIVNGRGIDVSPALTELLLELGDQLR